MLREIIILHLFFSLSFLHSYIPTTAKASLVHNGIRISSNLTKLKEKSPRLKDESKDNRRCDSVCNFKDHLNENRRVFLRTIFAMSHFLAVPQESNAGELGQRINAVVTQSDLGITVRRSVVRGAQVMDKLDGKWEGFSDSFNLGAQRSKQGARPKPKVIPEPLALDEKVAASIIQVSDTAFLEASPGINAKDLRLKVQQIDDLVRKSFERSGVSLNSLDVSLGNPMTQQQYNYLCYVHFRAFNELLLQRKVKFNEFLQEFEKKIGISLLGIFFQSSELNFKSNSTPLQDDNIQNLKRKLFVGIEKIDCLTELFKQAGLISLHERSDLDIEKINDWANNLTDLQFTIALDGDATINSQILLQEQGYRLYPSLARFAVAAILKNEFQGLMQGATLDDYYMDTDYNSDPDKFDAKEILLNVVIDSI